MLASAGAVLLAGGAPASLILGLDDNDLQAAIAASFVRPFAQGGGPAVSFAPGGFDAEKLPDMVDDGRTIWDVCTTDFAAGVTLARAGLMEEIDFSVVPRNAATWWGVPAFAAGLALAHDGAHDRAPQNFHEFFDLAGFPGPRAMPRTLIVGLLEAALLADGVAPEALYPIETGRAFKRLRGLRPDMRFWGDGRGARALLATEAVAGLLPVTAARPPDDRPILFAAERRIVSRKLWAVPKGGPAGAPAAMRFIAAAQDPARQLAFAMSASLPPQKAGEEVATNEAWYVDNAGWLLAEWQSIVRG